MRAIVVAYDGFNELDVFANLHILNRLRRVRPEAGFVAEVAAATACVTSMNGVQITVRHPLEAVAGADAVVIGSGGTAVAVEDQAFMSALRLGLDPDRQIIGSQCSGALVLARLGLLDHQPATSDLTTRPYLEAMGVTMLDQPLVAAGNVATAGGCLSSAHLSAWIIGRLLDPGAAQEALAAVAPVGPDRATFVDRIMQVITTTPVTSG